MGLKLEWISEGWRATARLLGCILKAYEDGDWRVVTPAVSTHDDPILSGRAEPPTLAAAQEAAEAAASRLLAEDAGVRALLAPAERRDYPCRACAGTGWMHPDDPAGECRICDGHGTLTADAFAKDIAADLREVERERDELRAMLPKTPETPWGTGAPR